MQEVSVADAAKQLSKTERTVLGYIAEKRLKAKKVGRKWFVDQKSLTTLAKKLDAQGLAKRPEANGAPGRNVTRNKSSEISGKGFGNSPENLVCFRLCCEAFASSVWQEARLAPIRDEVLKELGAGYYSYGRTKLNHYAAARSQLGAAVGLAEGLKFAPKQDASAISDIKSRLIPAVSSLIKRMERTHGR